MTRQLIAALSLALFLAGPASAAPPSGLGGRSIVNLRYRNITMHSMDVVKIAWSNALPLARFKLTNNGNQDTGSFKMIYHVVVDGTAVLVGEHPTPQASLSAGETRMVELWLPQVPYYSKQYYNVYANANFDHAVPESTYADNSMSIFTYK